ncbi:hypothetical protein E2C01_015474 [Portunus trituberculatus]|uniref:Uncharacterized protein n=1 Tax=Portunus trituberculatus TaxID=210409 RepID=A0A5B7DN09_PORTR|nr:hypothetical protein [Portunus trituberculatus]
MCSLYLLVLTLLLAEEVKCFIQRESHITKVNTWYRTAEEHRQYADELMFLSSIQALAPSSSVAAVFLPPAAKPQPNKSHEKLFVIHFGPQLASGEERKALV